MLNYPDHCGASSAGVECHHYLQTLLPDILEALPYDQNSGCMACAVSSDQFHAGIHCFGLALNRITIGIATGI